MKNALTLPFFVLFLAILPSIRAETSEPPVPVRTFPPKYPTELRRDGTAGLVTVRCLIDEKGNVAEIEVEKCSNDAFRAPSMEAVRKWKFKPAKVDGAAVAKRVTIPIQFTMGD